MSFRLEDNTIRISILDSRQRSLYTYLSSSVETYLYTATEARATGTAGSRWRSGPGRAWGRKCRVLALTRPQFVDEAVCYAAGRVFRAYVPTNGHLMRTEVIDSLADGGGLHSAWPWTPWATAPN